MPEYEALKARFEGMDAQVMGVSIDSQHTNKAWANSLGGISYPLLCDFWPHGEVARKYGVLMEEKGMTERAIVIVDKQGKVAYIDVHEIGEQPDPEAVFEVLRKLD
jgi:alkyl hydroperoxide reductase subunit AhpC